MLIEIDFQSDIPIYEQLKKEIIKGIAKGFLNQGESLPSVRQMAKDIGINLHTVNKAYNDLKEEGYVVIDRRKGAKISYKLPEATDRFKEKLNDELEIIVASCKCRGYDNEQILNVCKEILEKYS